MNFFHLFVLKIMGKFKHKLNNKKKLKKKSYMNIKLVVIIKVYSMLCMTY